MMNSHQRTTSRRPAAPREQREVRTKSFPVIRLCTNREEIKLSDEQSRRIEELKEALSRYSDEDEPSYGDFIDERNSLDKKVADIDKRITCMYQQIREIKEAREIEYLNQHPEVQKRREDSKRIAEINSRINELKEQLTKKKDVQESLKMKENNQRKQLGFGSQDEAFDRYKELEFQIETIPMTNKDYNDKLAEMTMIKHNIEAISNFGFSNEQRDALTKEIEAIKTELTPLYKERTDLQNEIEALYQQNKGHAMDNSPFERQILDCREEIRKLNKEKREAEKQKQNMGTTFHRNRIEHQERINKCLEIQYQMDLIYQEAESYMLQIWEKEQQIALPSKRNDPVLKKIKEGKALIAYLENLGSDPKTDQKNVHGKQIDASTSELLASFASKRQKKQKTQKKKNAKLQHSFETLGQFAELGLTAPTSEKQIQESIQAIQRVIEQISSTQVKAQLGFKVDDHGRITVGLDLL